MFNIFFNNFKKSFFFLFFYILTYKEDLPSKVQSSVNEEKDIEGIKLLYHNLDTKGIGYLKFNFDEHYS